MRRSLLALLAVLAPSIASANPGGIKGVVIFEGEAPERKTLDRKTDPYCAKIAKLAEDVVVTKGKLKDVLVRVKNGTGGKHTAPAAPALIDQRECMYMPRVVGVIAGQKLSIRNSDGTFHNVRGNLGKKVLWNKPQPAKDPDLALEATATPGDIVDVVCDVHPWMHSYAVVMDHPYFAVTGEDGSFEIRGLAPGKYTIEAWHPTLGTKTLDIKIGVGAKAVVPARFSFKNP